MVDAVFVLSVQALRVSAAFLGMTYQEINVLVFLVLWPLLTVWLVWLCARQRRRLRALAAVCTRLPSRSARVSKN